MADPGPSAATPSVKRFPCKQCGARLVFAPGTSSLRCPYCSAENQIAAAESQVTPADLELDYAATLGRLKGAAPSVRVETVTCGSCAAEVHLPDRTTARDCPYCGAAIVATERSCTLIRPNAILPFDIPRDRAVASFRAWITSRWFAPNRLKREAMLDATLKGVYMPSWTYDTVATTEYTGQRGEAYYVDVGSGNNRRRERRVRWYPAAGTVVDRFDDVLVLASHSLPSDLAHQLEPWGTDRAVPYADDYLAGFAAEAYQTTLEDGFTEAQQQMRPVIESSIRLDIGGDEQRITSADSRFDQITFKHLLLPVWISAYRFNGKVFRFLINARTGEVQGQRPYSPVKIALAVIGGAIAVALLVILLSRLKQ